MLRPPTSSHPCYSPSASLRDWLALSSINPSILLHILASFRSPGISTLLVLCTSLGQLTVPNILPRIVFDPIHSNKPWAKASLLSLLSLLSMQNHPSLYAHHVRIYDSDPLCASVFCFSTSPITSAFTFSRLLSNYLMQKLNSNIGFTPAAHHPLQICHVIRKYPSQTRTIGGDSGLFVL